jgi:hypothetical protein
MVVEIDVNALRVEVTVAPDDAARLAAHKLLVADDGTPIAVRVFALPLSRSEDRSERAEPTTVLAV